MKSYLIIVLCSLLITALPLCAQTEELPELQTESLQDNWLQKLYDELNSEGHQLSVNSRFRISDYATNGLLSLQLIERDVQLNTNFYSTKAGPLRGNFIISRINPKTTLKELHIGSYRPVWGMGTVFKQSSNDPILFSVQKSPHPLYMSPQGVALIASENDFYLYFLASLEKRSANLQEDKIVSLYQSHRDDPGKVMEQLLSGGMEFRRKYFVVGTMVYWQGYDHSFANQDYERNLSAFSLSGKLKSKTAFLAAEGTLIGNKSALEATLGFKASNVEQSVGFSYRENVQIPAYAAKPYLLSSAGERTEFFWNLDFPATENIDLGLRHALMRKNSSLQSPTWLSRSILSFAFHPEASTVNAQLSRMDREVVALTDSSYANTLPIHYRAKLQFKQKISKPLELKVLFRYYYEDKLKAENNSFFWENSLSYKKKALQLEAGLQSWQSLRTIISAEDELSNPDGQSIATSEDNQLFGSVKFYWRSLHFGAEIHQSWLSAKRNIYLSFGV